MIEGERVDVEGVLDKYRMAMVFQSGALLNSLTVGENVMFGLRNLTDFPESIRLKKAREKLALVGLSNIENMKPINKDQKKTINYTTH